VADACARGGRLSEFEQTVLNALADMTKRFDRIESRFDALEARLVDIEHSTLTTKVDLRSEIVTGLDDTRRMFSYDVNRIRGRLQKRETAAE